MNLKKPVKEIFCSTYITPEGVTLAWWEGQMSWYNSDEIDMLSEFLVSHLFRSEQKHGLD
jgi:hypothetical protein